MTHKQEELIETFIGLLPDTQKSVLDEILHFITGLGYIPQKQKVSDFVLSLKHGANKKVIAKMGVRKQAGFIGIRFFACKNAPEKYVRALLSDIEARNGQYSSPTNVNPIYMETRKSPDTIEAPDNLEAPENTDNANLSIHTMNTITNRCGHCGDICSGGGLGYYIKTPDGRELSRCGAYPIVIPDVTDADIPDMKRVILEQHEYFMSIA